MATARKAGSRSGNIRDAERTKARLLEAAQTEFAEHGLSGARVSNIVEAAGVNKQLLYYYFGDKEALYAKVLLSAYSELRKGEQSLHLDLIPPVDAIRKLIEFNFDYLVEHPQFVRLLTDENLHKGRHLRDSPDLKELHAGLSRMLADLFERGIAEGVLKRRVDPIDFYIMLASLCFFPFSNAHSLGAIFDRDLSKADETARRRAQIVQLMLIYLSTPET